VTTEERIGIAKRITQNTKRFTVRKDGENEGSLDGRLGWTSAAATKAFYNREDSLYGGRKANATRPIREPELFAEKEEQQFRRG
jgi:hypothetical protein